MSLQEYFVEIVGGSLSGYWIGFDSDSNYQKIMIVEVLEDERTEELRKTVARDEANAKRDKNWFMTEPPPNSQHVVSGFLAGLMVNFTLNKQYEKRKKQLEALEDQEPEISVVACYPTDCSVATVSEEDRHFVRSRSKKDFENTFTANKESAFALSNSWKMAISAATQSSLMDDMLSLPDEVDTCLLVHFVDGNTALIADYTKEFKEQLDSNSLNLSADDYELVQLMIEDPVRAIDAIRKDMSAIRTESLPVSHSAVEALRQELTQKKKLHRYDRLIKFGEMLHDGQIAASHSRITTVKRRVLSLDISDY